LLAPAKARVAAIRSEAGCWLDTGDKPRYDNVEAGTEAAGARMACQFRPTASSSAFLALDSCYACAMADHTKTLDRVQPSATPSEADAWAWEALPREEQLRLLRAALTHLDCTAVSPATMSDILAEARKRADARRRG
jgi:hypothetical protein